MDTPSSSNNETRPHTLVWADLNIAKFIFWSTTFNFAFEGGCNYPLDLVKTRLQVQSSVYASTFPSYSGTFDAMRTIVKQEGLRGLWKGFGVTSVAYLPTQAIFYGTYEFNKDRLSKAFHFFHRKVNPGTEPDADRIAVMVAFLSGGFAELMAGFLWVPMDVIVQRLQIQGPSTQHHLYKGGFDAFQKIVSKEGVIGLYRGYSASMLSYIPAAAVSWATYEFMKQKLYKYNVDVWIRNLWDSLFPRHSSNIGGTFSSHLPGGHHDPRQRKESHIVNFLSGVTGGVFASVVVNPMDVAKTRLQTDTYIRDATRTWEPPLHHVPAPIGDMTAVPFSPPNPTSPPRTPSGLLIQRKYSGLLSALRIMVQEEGPAALMKGVLPRIMFFAPLAGMQYSIYELAKSLAKCSDEELKARGLDD